MLNALLLLAALAAPQQAQGPDLVLPDQPALVDAPVLARLSPPFLRGGEAETRMVADTPTARPIAVDHSDAYYTRLTVHRWASYLMIPVFVGQYVAGRQLMDKSSDAPAWARVGHRVLATATMGLFAVNTVTGGINFWQARSDPDRKTRRTLHAVSMLIADAGFVAVGLLANPAETDGNLRTLHKRIAIGSMGLSTASWVIMLPMFDSN